MIGSLKHLVSGRELTAEEETRAIILGWCVEWVRAMVATLSQLVMVLGASSMVHTYPHAAHDKWEEGSLSPTSHQRIFANISAECFSHHQLKPLPGS